MRILHVVPSYLPAYRYGGSIESVHAQNKYLVRAGASVTVYTTAIDGPRDLDVPLGTPVDRDGVKVYYFKPGHPRSWFYSPAMATALRDRARDFDIIHITSVFLAASTLGARAARAASRPYLISPLGALMRAPLQKKSPLKKKIYMQLVERKNLEHADAIHFTVESEKAEYQQLGYRLRNGIIIPNGLDPASLPAGDANAFRKKFGVGKDKKVVLFLGRLNWKKGLDTLIPAFAAVAKEMPQALLVLAGGDDENYKPTLNKLAAASGIADKVIFTGPLSGAEKSSAYQAASVFALPSYAENFAITVAEAMHFGVPVVVSDGVGLSAQVRRSESGLVVPKDTKAVSAALIEILRDPVSAKTMGERGKELAVTLSYDKVARAFLAAYNGIIADHRIV